MQLDDLSSEYVVLNFWGLYFLPLVKVADINQAECHTETPNNEQLTNTFLRQRSFFF